jgi:hypothetical protein
MVKLIYLCPQYEGIKIKVLCEFTCADGGKLPCGCRRFDMVLNTGIRFVAVLQHPNCKIDLYAFLYCLFIITYIIGLKHADI